LPLLPLRLRLSPIIASMAAHIAAIAVTAFVERIFEFLSPTIYPPRLCRCGRSGRSAATTPAQ